MELPPGELPRDLGPEAPKALLRVMKNHHRARLAWAKRTQGSGGTAEAGRMLPTAASEMARAGLDSGVTVRLSSELDPPGRYLGCANGVVDLDTGRLLPPSEAAGCLITLATAMSYVPSVTHELVEGLARHLAGEEREFLFDSFAYALRGIPDRRFIVMAGPPNGGKSSVCEAMAAALGESLAFSLPQNSLLQEKYPHRNQHNAGLTKLLTHRFAMASEIPGGNTPVDAGQLKTVSGGDSMALREPNERHREDRPVSATLFLCLNTERDGCNDLDRLPLQDAAVRDRVQIVLMPEVPGERDPRVMRRLRSKTVATAMLAELVRRAAGSAGAPGSARVGARDGHGPLRQLPGLRCGLGPGASRADQLVLGLGRSLPHPRGAVRLDRVPGR